MKRITLKVRDIKTESEKEYKYIKDFAKEVGADPGYISKMSLQNNPFIYKYRYKIERVEK